MEVGLVRLSKDPVVTDAALEEIADAIDEQSRYDTSVFRQTGYVPCRYYPNATASVNVASGAVSTKGLPDGVAPHLVLDYPTDQGELGDHYVTDAGLPILRSFWGPTKDSGGDLMGPTGLSSVVSHEHTEASEDPYANRWVQLPDDVARKLGAKSFAMKADEACDECESFSYQRPGLRPYLSDLLSPRSTRPGPGPYDLMRKLSSWDDLPPDCYRILMIDGAVKSVFGDGYSPQKLALKMLPSSKASRRGVDWTVDHHAAAYAVPWFAALFPKHSDLLRAHARARSLRPR